MSHTEAFPVEHDPSKLDDRSKERFNAMLQDAASYLELIAAPDIYTRETRKIPFGNFSDGKLMLSHTNDMGFHSGIISFREQSPSANGFLYKNTIPSNTIWESGDRRVSGATLLRQLEMNWPLSADRVQLDSLLRGLAEQPNATDISTEQILNLLDGYAMGSTHSEVEHEKQWNYSEVSADHLSQSKPVAALSFVIIGSPETTLRQIRADVTIAYKINNTEIPLVLHVHSDELNDIVVNASYIDPETNREFSVPINDYASVYAEVDGWIKKLIAEKEYLA